MDMVSEKLEYINTVFLLLSGSPFLLDLEWMPRVGMGRSQNLLIKCQILYQDLVCFNDYVKCQGFFCLCFCFFMTISQSEKLRFRDIK